jgi:hypothetical protein
MLLWSSDLKVDVHRKNSSESSEEMATLRPVVEKVSVHRAEQCTQADNECFKTKLQGNSQCSIVLHYTHEGRIMTVSPLNCTEQCSKIIFSPALCNPGEASYGLPLPF